MFDTMVAYYALITVTIKVLDQCYDLGVKKRCVIST